MKNKAPAYQWYPDKALSDMRRLSWTAKGIYRELLDVIWIQFQETCTMPDDDEFISSMLGCSLETWVAARAEIQNKYHPMLKEKPTGLFSKGLWKEREKQVLRREKLSENGKKGGRPKTKKKQNLSLPSPSPIPVPIPTVLDNDKFRDKYITWMKHRKEIKHPLQRTTMRTQLDKMATWGPARAIEAMDYSIMQGWQGLFERDDKQKPQSQQDDIIMPEG